MPGLIAKRTAMMQSMRRRLTARIRRACISWQGLYLLDGIPASETATARLRHSQPLIVQSTAIRGAFPRDRMAPDLRRRSILGAQALVDMSPAMAGRARLHGTVET
jgi:hypothetical protein